MTQKLEALHLEAICEAVGSSSGCSNQGHLVPSPAWNLGGGGTAALHAERCLPTLCRGRGDSASCPRE